MSEVYTKPNDVNVSIIEIESHLDGSIVDLLDFVERFEIEEDLFENATTAVFDISDSLNLPETFPIINGETIKIKFQTDSDSDEIEYSFIVYDVTDIRQVNETTLGYRIYAISKEQLVSNVNVISRTFFNKRTADIVRLVFNELGGDKEIAVRDTVNIQHFIAPSWSPFKVINWCASISHSPQYDGAGFLFYEDKDQYNFVSVEELCQEEPILELKYEIQNKNLISPDQSSSGQSIVEYEIIEKNNLLSMMGAGLTGSRTTSVDPLVRTSLIDNWEMPRQQENMETLGDFPFQNNEFELLGTGSKFNVLFTKTHRTRSQYVQSNSNSELSSKPETTMPIRSSLLTSLTEGIAIRVVTQGNSNITVGKTIDVRLPAYSSLEPDKDKDSELLSGKYLVISCNHIINQNRDHQTILILSKPKYSIEPVRTIDV